MGKDIMLGKRNIVGNKHHRLWHPSGAFKKEKADEADEANDQRDKDTVR